VDGPQILSAIRQALPEHVQGMRLLGISEDRTIFLRYEPGDSFPSHTDSPYVPGSSSQSLFTLVIYLNDDYEGGETFFPDHNQLVRPQTGTALIFAHGIRHEALKLLRGAKYALHTFVMYGAGDHVMTPVGHMLS
jgi:hypothetical protein